MTTGVNQTNGTLPVTTESDETSPQGSASNTSNVDLELIHKWIKELLDPNTRENAMIELCQKREIVADMAPLIWNSFGTMTVLLQEIIDIYPYLQPPILTAFQSNRVCNALALLQCVASHPETKKTFILGNLPFYLYPFLNSACESKSFEYLRLTTLGVIGALVKSEDSEIINYLLTTEIIPLCLRIMETGTDLSKTVATFILQKILLDETGLFYICQTYERFSHVARILGNIVLELTKKPSPRLLKHVVRCYLRLSDNQRACKALCQCLPDQLKEDNVFSAHVKEDKTTGAWLFQLLKNLELMSLNNRGQFIDDSANRMESINLMPIQQ